MQTTNAIMMPTQTGTEMNKYYNSIMDGFEPTMTNSCNVLPSQNYWHNWYYPSAPLLYYYRPDKTRTAFATAKALLKSEFIKIDKIEEFIRLVEMIEKEL